jgi:hypothetical protein
VISGRGKGLRPVRLRAGDMTELHVALDHHYGGGHLPDTSDVCPLCRLGRSLPPRRRRPAPVAEIPMMDGKGMRAVLEDL